MPKFLKKNDLDDLVNRLKKSDKEAFNLLFYMYAEKLFKFSMTFYNEAEDAEEIVQEVFLKIWINRKTISNPATFNAFIYTIAKNKIFNNLKKNVYKKKYESYVVSNRCLENCTENEVFYREKQQLIEKALDRLPKKRKEIFLLSRIEGLKNREIAEQLNISIKTVETHMSLSLKFLRGIFHMHKDKILTLTYVLLFSF